MNLETTPVMDPPPAERADPPIDPGGRLELLTFTMDSQLFSIDIMAVREIRGWSQPTTLPHSAKSLLGVINLRGTVLPIVDLAARFHGTKTPANDRNVIIVIEMGDELLGILVESVSDILAIDQEILQKCPDESGDPYEHAVSELALVDDTMIRIIDPTFLFDTPNQSN